MVVLLIMAILLAIAIPTFLGVKGGAQDRATQSNLNTALTNAKAIYGNNQAYGGVTQAQGRLSMPRRPPDLRRHHQPGHRGGTVAVRDRDFRQIEVSTSAEQPGRRLLLVNQLPRTVDCWRS